MVALISLHDHLDGALRPATVVELAKESEHALPFNDPHSLGQWFRESADSGSLDRYLLTFEHTVGVMQTAAALERVAREYVLDCASEGVIYAEVRWAPEQHLRGGLNLDQAVAAVGQGLAAGCKQVVAAGGHICVVQILCAMRHLDRSLEIAQLTVRHRTSAGNYSGPAVANALRSEEPVPGSVVGFDLAGPESGFRPSRHRAALDLLTQHKVPVTLHAGEADSAESIKEALEIGRALRIGHGVRLLETDPQATSDLSRWIRDRRIPLEICPSSNLQTGAAGSKVQGIFGHPVTRLLRLGFTVTISPDNRLMSGTSVSKELEMLRQEAEWTQHDVETVQRNAARAAFVPRVYQEYLERQVSEQADFQDRSAL